MRTGGDMKISIKSFDVDMQVKNKGIEFEVYDNGGQFRGDLILTKTNLIWCEGKKRRENGVKITWDEFISWMNEE